MADYAGIDYGMGTTNRDPATGIRYGVIAVNDLHEWAWESFDANYGDPTCPKCRNTAVDGDTDLPEHERNYCLNCRHNHGNRFRGGSDPVVKDSSCQDCNCREPDWAETRDHYEVLHHACGDYACDMCKVLFDGEDAYGDEPHGYNLDDGTYEGFVDSHNALMLVKSPYYTNAQFCSPCAPGAGHLGNPCPDGPKTYCLGHDWFTGEKAPYPIYDVKTGELVSPPAKE